MHPVIKTVLERIALGIATLFVVSLVIFSAIELLPGDFSQVILGQAATKANMAAISKELGLDQPPHCVTSSGLPALFKEILELRFPVGMLQVLIAQGRLLT